MSVTPFQPANRLASKTSPYLLQHADNPVDWYPWREEAFARARAEDKPIFLSVGYATCHWCHVMERESFKDETVARQLAEGFIAIKVDREELPDVDHVYMSALQALNDRGGWPMNMFLTPQLSPFFGGTYFPPRRRPGMPRFSDVLAKVREAWHQRRAELEQQARQLLARVHQNMQPSARVATAVGATARRPTATRSAAESSPPAQPPAAADGPRWNTNSSTTCPPIRCSDTTRPTLTGVMS